MESIRLYQDSPDLNKITEIAKRLRDGDIIIYPTDTLYAIGCDAMHSRAVERICKLKKINPQKVNLSIICHSISQASEYARINKDNFKILREYLPGAFTFILPTNSVLPKIFKNRKTVGIRIPNNNIATELSRILGNPLLTSSVFIDYNEPGYTTNPELIAEKYEGEVDFMIDGGDGDITPSTIVDCCDNEPIITRQGAGIFIV